MKQLLVGLAIGVFLMVLAGIANAGLIEIVPVGYTFNEEPDSGRYKYYDETGNQLIDGAYGTFPWGADLGNGHAYEWVGWKESTPVYIDFDLGGSTEINQINIGTVQNKLSDVVLPSVNLYSSSDGSSWVPFLNYYVPEDSANNRKYFTYELAGFSITAQFFRVGLYHSLDGPWTFTDEIDFYRTSSTPEPTTMLLLGIGLVSLVGGSTIRRQRKTKESIVD